MHYDIVYNTKSLETAQILSRGNWWNELWCFHAHNGMPTVVKKERGRTLGADMASSLRCTVLMRKARWRIVHMWCYLLCKKEGEWKYLFNFT